MTKFYFDFGRIGGPFTLLDSPLDLLYVGSGVDGVGAGASGPDFFEEIDPVAESALRRGVASIRHRGMTSRLGGSLDTIRSTLLVLLTAEGRR